MAQLSLSRSWTQTVAAWPSNGATRSLMCSAPCSARRSRLSTSWSCRLSPRSTASRMRCSGRSTRSRGSRSPTWSRASPRSRPAHRRSAPSSARSWVRTRCYFSRSLCSASWCQRSTR
ncbi:hypothetical protein ACFPRL_27100 [Pseudoclavibacter helvolus]